LFLLFETNMGFGEELEKVKFNDKLVKKLEFDMIIIALFVF